MTLGKQLALLFFLHTRFKKHIRLLAAVIIVVLALMSVLYIYGMAYPFKNDNGSFSRALYDFSAAFIYNAFADTIVVDADIMETREMDRGLIAFFRDRNNAQVFGHAYFEKGLNRRYGLARVIAEAIPYSAFVSIVQFDPDDKSYRIVGHNLDGVYAFGIEIYGNPSVIHNLDWEGNIVGEAIFLVESKQFILISSKGHIYEQAGFSSEQVAAFQQYQYPISSKGILYDEEWNDVTENYFLENIKGSGFGASTSVRANYFLIILTLVLAYATVRRLLAV